MRCLEPVCQHSGENNRYRRTISKTDRSQAKIDAVLISKGTVLSERGGQGALASSLPESLTTVSNSPRSDHTKVRSSRPRSGVCAAKCSATRSWIGAAFEKVIWNFMG